MSHPCVSDLLILSHLILSSTLLVRLGLSPFIIKQTEAWRDGANDGELRSSLRSMFVANTLVSTTYPALGLCMSCQQVRESVCM
jgi:hypothetical protein